MYFARGDNKTAVVSYDAIGDVRAVILHSQVIHSLLGHLPHGLFEGERTEAASHAADNAVGVLIQTGYGDPMVLPATQIS